MNAKDKAGLTARSSLLDRIAIGAIAGQLAVMVAISYALWQRHGLSADFAGFYHAWSAIAHGELNPWHQDAENVRYLQNHGEIITWIVAPLYWLLPNALGLRLVQDLSTTGVSLVCYLWIRRFLAGATLGPKVAAAVGVASLALVVLDPWPIWSNAFDFHWQATGTFFLVAAAYAFYRRRFVIASVACILAVSCGDVTATITIGLGIALACMRGLRRWGAGVVALGLGAFLAIHALGGGQGYASAGAGLESLYGDLFLPEHPRGVTAAGLLLFALAHPQNVAGLLARNLKDIYANVAPAGIVGIVHPWAWGVSLVTLLENNLTSRAALPSTVPSSLPPCVLSSCLERNFAQPSFQSFPLYAFTAIGTAGFLVTFAARVRPAIAYAASFVLLLNVAGWAAVWLPQIPARWVVVRPVAAAELSRIDAAIPRGEEVIGGEAFLGLFADRPIYYNSIHPAFPLRTSPTSIVIAPYDGVNVLGANADLSRIAALAADPHARLMSHAEGVWWFRYLAAPGGTSLALPSGADVIPAWTLDGISGRARIDGPLHTWRMEYERERGNVFQNDYWRLPLGRYEATIEIENTEPVIFEIRNASGEEVIMRRELAPAPRKTYTIPFEHALQYDERGYAGWGPFQFDPSPFQYNALELRVWSPGTGKLAVYAAGIAAMKQAPSAIFR